MDVVTLGTATNNCIAAATTADIVVPNTQKAKQDGTASYSTTHISLEQEKISYGHSCSCSSSPKPPASSLSSRTDAYSALTSHVVQSANHRDAHMALLQALARKAEAAAEQKSLKNSLKRMKLLGKLEKMHATLPAHTYQAELQKILQTTRSEKTVP